MINEMFSDFTSVVLQKSLEGAGMRHRAIADNIANAETPGYTRKDVNFEDQLKKAFEPGVGTLEDRIQGLMFTSEDDTSNPAKPDGNNVSMDKEMGELSKNTIEYETLVQLLNLKGSMVRAAISEGRR